MKKALIIGSVAMCIPALASADFIGFRVGASAWNQNYEGTVQSGPDTLDIQNQLGLDDETNNSFYISFEHPVPLIPNIKLARTEMDIKEDNIITENFIFDGIPFRAGNLVTTDSDLTHTDLTLYYELLDNWVSLDLGITLRQFDEGISLSYKPVANGPTVSANEEIDEVRANLMLGISGTGCSKEI